MSCMDEVRETLVQASYFHLAAEKGLTVMLTAPGRAVVPTHWRAEAEARIQYLLDVLPPESE